MGGYPGFWDPVVREVVASAFPSLPTLGGKNLQGTIYLDQNDILARYEAIKEIGIGEDVKDGTIKRPNIHWLSYRFI